MTHPHHPLYGQRVQLVRVRRGPDPDLIIRMPDGYHGAIAASLTDYAGASEAASSVTEPPLLALEGLWRMPNLLSSNNGFILFQEVRRYDSRIRVSCGLCEASEVCACPRPRLFVRCG